MLCNTDKARNTYILGVTSSVKLWEPHFRKLKTIVMHSSASFSPQASQSVVDLGFQHSLPPFPTVSGHCLCFFFLFPIHLSLLLTHLSIFCTVALFFFLLPPQLLQFFFTFSGFAFFRPQPRINTTK